MSRNNRRMRIAVRMAYCGTRFSGFQSQPRVLTIQRVLNMAITRLLKTDETMVVHGAGRTDAGVHAASMPAHFDVPATTTLSPALASDPAALTRALNAHTSRVLRSLKRDRNDIHISDARPVPVFPGNRTWHARYSAISRKYVYTLCLEPPASPLLGIARANWVWDVSPAGISRADLEEAVAVFQGRHEFSAFRSPKCSATRTLRDIDAISLAPSASWPGALDVTIESRAFLHNQVRNIIGAAVDAASPSSPVHIDHLRSLLSSGGVRSDLSSQTAPPSPLVLQDVCYPPQLDPWAPLPSTQPSTQ